MRNAFFSTSFGSRFLTVFPSFQCLNEDIKWAVVNGTKEEQSSLNFTRFLVLTEVFVQEADAQGGGHAKKRRKKKKGGSASSSSSAASAAAPAAAPVLAFEKFEDQILLDNSVMSFRVPPLNVAHGDPRGFSREWLVMLVPRNALEKVSIAARALVKA